jgi:hypothetical protein
MAANIAGEIQDQAVNLARSKPGAAADLLDKQAWTTCRPQEPDEIDVWNIEADREDIDPGQAADCAGAEGVKYRAPLVAWRIRSDRFATDLVPTDCVAHRIGMRNAGAEADPGAAVFPPFDDLGDRAFDYIGDVGGAFQFFLDEFTTTPADACDINARIRRLGRELTQVAVSNSFRDLVRKDDLLEERAVTLMQVTGIEPKTGRTGADDLQAGLARSENVKKGEILPVSAARNKLAFVDNHQIAGAEPFGVARQ